MLDVVNDIVGNLQDIIRLQIRLAKAEVAEEVHEAKSSVTGLGITLLAGALALIFLLVSAMFALTGVLTNWGAALVVAGAMALVSVASLTISTRRSGARKTAGRTGASNS